MSYGTSTLNETGFSIVTDLAILLVNETDYVLYDVYNHCKLRGGVLNVTKLGTWRRDEGLVITLTGSKIDRRRNYNGLRVKSAGIVSSSPLINSRQISSSILEHYTYMLSRNLLFTGIAETERYELGGLFGR